jgi:hypothetical protein
MKKEKILEFIKKYKIILILALVIVVLVVSKLNNKNNETENQISISPTPTPYKNINIKNLKSEDLMRMNDEEINYVLDNLTEEELNQIPEANPELPLNSMLPYEGEDFRVVKYIKEKVLLVEAKTEDIKKAESSLRKWLDFYEEEIGENAIVWK